MTSIELPRALQPWTEPLGMLGPMVHDGLGRWLHPLRSLLGPLALPRSASAGDPDGYAGLHRRGSYERLLLSEWALALEIPDEFLRRAAAGEHVFVAPAFVEPQAASTSVALLDAGPRQLGAPRLLHLALLVVLQQRAIEGGASFRFGVLQDDDGAVCELTPPAIQRWAGRGSWQPSAVNAAAWEARLAELAAPDTWLVGSAELRPLAHRMGAGLVEIEEVIHEGAPGLRAHAHHRMRGSRAITVTLPPADDCVRILRSPLATRSPAPRPPTGDDAELCTDQLGQLSIDGRRWLLAFRDGSVGALHVPNTNREPPGHTKVVLPHRGTTVLAADVKGKRPIVLAVSDDGELLLRGSGLALGYGSPTSIWTVQPTGLLVPYSFRRPRAPQLLTMFVTAATSTAFSAYILDEASQLWELQLELERTSHAVATRAIAPRDRACRNLWRLDAETVAWISDGEQHLLSSRALPGGEHPLLSEEQRAQCIVGPLHLYGREALRFAVPHGNSLQIHDFGAKGDPLRSIRQPPGRPFGLRVSPAGALASHFVALYVGIQGRLVYAQQPDTGANLLFSTSSPITQIRHEPACDKIVWRTELGELGVYDPARRTMLRRISPQGTTEAEP